MVTQRKITITKHKNVFYFRYRFLKILFFAKIRYMKPYYKKKDSFFLELKIKCKQILGGIFKGAAESEVHQTDTRARKMAELVM